MIRIRHVMASVRGIKIIEALLILFLAYNVMNEFDIAKVEALWLSHIQKWGALFISEFPYFL